MKTEIDWSKAPEGAIGFAPSTGNDESSIWYKKNENGDLVFTFANLKACWMKSYNVPENVIWRSEQWNDGGLPPVGTVCYALVTGRKISCEIVAHFGGRAVGVMADKESVFLFEAKELSPIRTPEQIAAEEREKAITAMSGVVSRACGAILANDVLLALYDAGFRKLEGGAQ